MLVVVVVVLLRVGDAGHAHVERVGGVVSWGARAVLALARLRASLGDAA